MFTVVPNSHELSCLSTTEARNPLDLSDFSRSLTMSGLSRNKPRALDDKFDMQNFVSSLTRSQRKELVQSLRLTRAPNAIKYVPHQPIPGIQGTMYECPPFRDSTEKSGFMNSLQLPSSNLGQGEGQTVPGSSGQSQIVQSGSDQGQAVPGGTGQGRVLSESPSEGHDLVDAAFDNNPPGREAMFLKEDILGAKMVSGPTPSTPPKDSYAIRPRPDRNVAATKFSRNIANPALRKKTHDKLVEATERSKTLAVNLSDSTSPVKRPTTLLSPLDNSRQRHSDSNLPRELSPGSATLTPSVAATNPDVLPGHTRSSSNLRNNATDFHGYTPPKHPPPLASSSRQISFHESLMVITEPEMGRNRYYIKDKLASPTSGSKEKLRFFSLLSKWRDKRNTSLQKLDANSDEETRLLTKSSSFSWLSRKPAQQEQQQHQKQQQQQKQQHQGHCRHASGHSDELFDCSCELYHSHRFLGEVHNNDIEAMKERRQEIILASLKLEDEQKLDSVDDPRIIFWYPTLSFHPYRQGDPIVSFASLWPKEKELREHLQNSGIQQTVLKDDAVMDLCVLAVTCGPLTLLKCLIQLQLIRIDQILESGAGLLHLALLAQNTESAQYLMNNKISHRIRDRQGLTADQVCYNSILRKQMAPRYIQSRDVSRDKVLLQPSLQDKDTIFKLASNPKDFVDIQKKLQTLDFNVNTECDNNGDFLLHIAVRKGLSQLPLLMALVKIQGADIELCNAEGMTPLMLAATVGNCVLCDVLICLFGADPNKPNSLCGRSALHFAAEGNHRKTVECLIRRGADVNIEDHNGLRPDDIPACIVATDDCREIIGFNRVQRLEMLSDLVKRGEVVTSQLLKSDLCVVDSDGHTLIMTAAIYNRYQTLNSLLELSRDTINAQHSKTGMTALAIAAQMGNTDSVSVLLRHDANPAIADMKGYLPLHQAVINNQEHTIEIFLDHFPKTYTGLQKAIRMSKKTSIHKKLRQAWDKRQEEIVTPKLLGCALNGDAEDLFLLLDEGDNINPKSGTGNWPLYLAVENGHLEVLKLLFERGGDIRMRHPTTGATALHVAAKMGHQTIVAYLLQYCRQSVVHSNMDLSTRAQSNSSMSRSSSFLSRTKGHSSKPAMVYSQTPKLSKAERRLLDINAVDRDNKTALQLAAEKGFSRIVELLLQHGATTAMLDSEGCLVTCPQFEGVRIKIEDHRQRHTREIIKLILDKSKKALPALQQIWLPKFDHHLRSKEGSTPLMVAAGTGRLPLIRYLLESAVYPEVEQYDSDISSDTDSDADSGVLDQTPGSSKEVSKQEDDFQLSQDATTSFFLGMDQADLRPELENSITATEVSETPEMYYQRRLNRIVHEANRPKGLSIYHDGLISHVCAVNLLDGSTALHYALKAGDVPQVLTLLLEYDPTPLNIQDDQGETILHLACRLGRKKTVELLLAHPDIDLNIRTLEGHLPEEVTTVKSIARQIEKARSYLPAMIESSTPKALSLAGGSDITPSINGSTVNFDKVHSRYEAMKQTFTPAKVS